MKPELRAQVQESLASRYTLERDLGRGGMASVVLARISTTSACYDVLIAICTVLRNLTGTPFCVAGL